MWNSLLNDDRAGADGQDSELKDCDLERAAIVRLIDGESSRFVPLPERGEIDDYRMMEDFIEAVKDPVISARLDEWIGGPGAFRRLKQLSAFRDERYLEVAREWCKEENIEAE